MTDTALEQKLNLLEQAIEQAYGSGLKPVRYTFYTVDATSDSPCGCVLTAAAWDFVDPKAWDIDDMKDRCEVDDDDDYSEDLQAQVAEDNVMKAVKSRFGLTDSEAMSIMYGFDFGTSIEFDPTDLEELAYIPSLVEFGRRMAKRFFPDVKTTATDGQ